ncbi:hypothetical protein NMY22_g12417 [Coprinellus aureogranulatus]|nr:hypothetical protein NMY22_g12417 [Coprinellus aureogranulatus]
MQEGGAGLHTRFATTVAHQVAIAIPTTASIIEGVAKVNPGLLSPTFIDDLISFFSKNTRTPSRFLITSRVENRIYQRLHESKQVCLSDLVEYTSDTNISAALDAAIAKEKYRRIYAFDKSWPSAEGKAQLVKHIGGSFIFMTTMI